MRSKFKERKSLRSLREQLNISLLCLESLLWKMLTTSTYHSKPQFLPWHQSRRNIHTTSLKLRRSMQHRLAAKETSKWSIYHRNYWQRPLWTLRRRKHSTEERNQTPQKRNKRKEKTEEVQLWRKRRFEKRLQKKNPSRRANNLR